MFAIIIAIQIGLERVRVDHAFNLLKTKKYESHTSSHRVQFDTFWVPWFHGVDPMALALPLTHFVLHL